MDNLIIEATKHTPLVRLDSDSHILEIRGESYPENILEFYGPVLDWVNAYLEEISGNQSVIVNIELIYFNSNSSKILATLFNTLQDAAMRERKIAVYWHYDEDNDISLEYGEEFREDLKSLPFHLVQIEGRS